MPLDTTITRHFSDLEDPRSEKNKQHSLINVITIALCSLISGADTWVDMERYGNAKRDWLSTFLDLSKGIPSHDTISRVFRWLDPNQFQACFMRWAQAIASLSQGEVIAIDGKKLRGSQDRLHDKDGIWLVSAWAEQNQLVLGQEKVSEKSNEITAIPALLKLLDIAECVVTIDAMGTQTEIVTEIVKQKADYILPVKNNQKHLRQDIEMLFDGFEAENYQDVHYDTHTQRTFAHDREEIRQCWMVEQPEYIGYLRHHQK
jgi:predicted transposase YbfD/YdcC